MDAASADSGGLLATWASSHNAVAGKLAHEVNSPLAAMVANVPFAEQSLAGLAMLAPKGARCAEAQGALAEARSAIAEEREASLKIRDVVRASARRAGESR